MHYPSPLAACPAPRGGSLQHSFSVAVQQQGLRLMSTRRPRSHIRWAAAKVGGESQQGICMRLFRPTSTLDRGSFRSSKPTEDTGGGPTAAIDPTMTCEKWPHAIALGVPASRGVVASPKSVRCLSTANSPSVSVQRKCRCTSVHDRENFPPTKHAESCRRPAVRCRAQGLRHHPVGSVAAP